MTRDAVYKMEEEYEEFRRWVGEVGWLSRGCVARTEREAADRIEVSVLTLKLDR